MSSSTGLFYAYARTINNDAKKDRIITFATRDVADTWWRLVTDSVAGGYTRFQDVSRVSMQLYTYNSSQADIWDTITDAQVALSLHGKMFFDPSRSAGRLIPIPVLNVIEFKNEHRYYVRSVADPTMFWSFHTSDPNIVVSRTHRVPFQIRLVDPQRARGTIIIPSDDVYLGDSVGMKNSYLNWLGAERLIFKFSDFKTRFWISRPASNDNSVLPRIGYVPEQISQISSDSWELVE